MLSEKQVRDLDLCQMLRKAVERLDQYLNLGMITEYQYQSEMGVVVRRLSELEEEYGKIDNRRSFDEMMGDPITHIEELCRMVGVK